MAGDFMTSLRCFPDATGKLGVFEVFCHHKERGWDCKTITEVEKAIQTLT